MQLLALLGISISGAVTLAVPQHGQVIELVTDRDGIVKLAAYIEYAIIVALACITGFGLYMGCIAWIRWSSVSMVNFQLLTSACQTYGSVVPSIPQTVSPVISLSVNQKSYMAASTILSAALGASLPVLALVALAYAVNWIGHGERVEWLGLSWVREQELG